MRAVRHHEYGGVETLVVEQVPDPHPGPGEIRVAAAGVNPVDWKVRSGAVQAVLPVDLPAVPECDAVGVVDETGEGVQGVSIGDRVLGPGGVTGATAEPAVPRPGPRAHHVDRRRGRRRRSGIRHRVGRVEGARSRAGPHPSHRGRRRRHGQCRGRDRGGSGRHRDRDGRRARPRVPHLPEPFPPPTAPASRSASPPWLRTVSTSCSTSEDTACGQAGQRAPRYKPQSRRPSVLFLFPHSNVRPVVLGRVMSSCGGAVEGEGWGCVVRSGARHRAAACGGEGSASPGAGRWHVVSSRRLDRRHPRTREPHHANPPIPNPRL
jgi:hypothetical protein